MCFRRWRFSLSHLFDRHILHFHGEDLTMVKNSLTDVYKLNDGNSIPCVGLGTWQTPDGEATVQAVKDALAAGL